MRILLTGASGFVGSLLAPRLLRDGHEVVAFGRDEGRLRESLAEGATGAPPALELALGDALTGEGLRGSMRGVEVAYYLIHSMERVPAGTASFERRERVAASNFAAAAAEMGVRRIVYLGGLVPDWERTAHPSRHLASREEVERILLASVSDSIALRASIVIGARSRSFRLLVRLLERMPVLTLPGWSSYRTQPIDERDVIEMLAASAAAQLPRRTFEIGGPDILTFGEMLTRIADLMLLGRPMLPIGVNLTAITGRVAAAIAGEDPELVVALMEGLRGDLLPADDDAQALLGVRLHSFDAAVEHALREWERVEELAAR